MHRAERLNLVSGNTSKKTAYLKISNRSYTIVCISGNGIIIPKVC